MHRVFVKGIGIGKEWPFLPFETCVFMMRPYMSGMNPWLFLNPDFPVKSTLLTGLLTSGWYLLVTTEVGSGGEGATWNWQRGIGPNQ